MPTISVGLPKKQLVATILDHLPHDLIRQELHIGPKVNLRVRLMSFTKLYLAQFFFKHRGGAGAIIADIERAYPLKRAPTLFLVRLTAKPDVEQLVSDLTRLERAERRGKLSFGEDRAVRAVYVRSRSRVILERPVVHEFELAYEKRISYVPADGRNRGRVMVVYALESALLWLPLTSAPYAVLACTDFQAVNPIQEYCERKLHLGFFCPYLSHASMRRIAAKAKSRTATFKALATGPGAAFDVTSMTLSDPRLETSALFHTVGSDPGRDQTSGFFIDHPDLDQAGLGISRRYARIWTPAILDRDSLVRLSTGVITKVAAEMRKMETSDLPAFVATFANLPVHVGRRRVTGRAREAFEGLVVAAWEAQRKTGRQELPVAEHLPRLLRHAEALRLRFRVEMDCPTCGEVLAHCPECWSPQTPILRGERPGEVRLLCNSRCQGNGRPARELVCFCGQPTEVLEPYQHLFAYPDEALERAVATFSEKAGVDFGRLFVIADGHLRLLQEHPDRGLRPLRLKDLHSWEKVPGISKPLTRGELSDGSRKRLRRYLRRTKEKCYRDGGPPTKVKCSECLATEQTRTRLGAGELCLGRLFGMPIGRKFDGIHHGHEKADIVYADRRRAAPGEETIAIHLKSYTRPGRSGVVGRSAHPIKGLYTQLFYLAYQVQAGKVFPDEPVGALGVSIPNEIADDVKDSMRHLCARLGVRLLIVEEEDWIAITKAAWDAMPAPPKKPRTRKRSGARRSSSGRKGSRRAKVGAPA